MSCDLHNHSTCSDGSVPIQRLPGIAARTGLHAIAISDHDTTLSAAYCYAHPRQEGVELIPAVELTGYDFERQHRVHLLCYYPNLDCVPLREHCEIMKQRRNACGLQTVHELEAMYPQFTEELVWETAAESGVIYKSGIMQVLGELGLSDGSIYGETYHKLFGWNPRGIVLHSPEYLPVREVLATAKASGGAVVFAHPTVYKSMPLVQKAPLMVSRWTTPATARRTARSACSFAGNTALCPRPGRISMAGTTRCPIPSAPVPLRTRRSPACRRSPANGAAAMVHDKAGKGFSFIRKREEV